MNRILQKLSPLLWAMVSTLTLSLAPFSLSAQESYPTRPLTLVVGFPPGGPNDILGRQIAKALTQRLNQPVEVINQETLEIKLVPRLHMQNLMAIHFY